MLKKLVKHELNWIYKVVVIFYILAAIFSVIGRIFAKIENSLLFDILSKISFSIAISMMINSLVNCILRLWARFIRNMYKDESYLTHTLPVSKSTLFNAKIISALITIFTTIIVILICLVICYYSKESIQVLKKLLELAASTYDTTVIKLLVLIAAVILLEIIYMVFIGYIGIILGYKKSNKKTLMSIIYSFVIYFVMQVITLIIIVICGLISPDIMNIINTTETIDINSIKTIMYIAIAIYSTFTLLLYVIGKKQLEKGVNIE